MQPLATHPCGTKTCSTVPTRVMPAIPHGSADQMQVWDLGSGYTGLLTSYLPSDKSLSSFHAVVFSLNLYIPSIYRAKSTSKLRPVPG